MEHSHDTRVDFDHSTITTTVISTLDGLVQDWDIEDAIDTGTLVVADLGFESIDLIQMVAALERAFKLKSGSLVDMLVADGRYVDDLSVDQIVQSIDKRLGQGAPRSAAER